MYFLLRHDLNDLRNSKENVTDTKQTRDKKLISIFEPGSCAAALNIARALIYVQ